MAKQRQRISATFADSQKDAKGVPPNPGKSFSDPHSANGGKGISATHKEMSRGGKDGSRIKELEKGGKCCK